MASKRTYKQYLQDEDPLKSMPKTSKWRMRRQIKDEESSSNSQLETACDFDNESEVSEPAQQQSEQSSQQQRSRTLDEDLDNTDVWYDTMENWYHAEESVWYDTEELQTGEDQASGNTTNNTDEELPFDDMPVYHGAPITVAQSALLILSFVFRHKLTGECLSDLLSLISLHCVTKNILHTSLYKFRSYFSALETPIVIHKFCSQCDILIKEEQLCTVCGSDLNDKSKTSYFVEIPLLSQITELFRRTNFHLSLQHRFRRTKKSENSIEDIYDGELYRSHASPGGILHSENNISLMWYTDGVPLFKSSRVSIWPLFFSINELPILERFKQENMLFAGLWFGKSKPSMSCFLKPFHDSLCHFRDEGFNIFCTHCDKDIDIKGILLCGTCDLPAKCMVLNMTQFNGKYGCPRCKQEGNVMKTGKGHTRVFPFDDSCPDGPKRTHEEFLQHGNEAFTSTKPVYGVKGPAWWMNCCPDIINGTAIDYMHSVLLGIVRRLLQLWFDPKYSKESFSISDKVQNADKRLAEIRPPYFIQRHPRDIKEQSKYWKASECRAWLFFYSVPVLFGLLNKNVFNHYLLFVEAIFILNLQSITCQELKHCEELLLKFSCLFSTLYGAQHMSANLHQMLHLHDNVKQLGPLWVYSCFSFESLNGKLVSLFHGTQNPVVQIASAVSSMLKLPALSMNVLKSTEIEALYKKLTVKGHHFRINETITEGAYVLGKLHFKVLDPKYVAAISQCMGTQAVGNCYMFYRILLNGDVYHSIKYNTHCRNSCTVIYSENNNSKCGEIMFYVKAYPLCFCNGNICKCTALYLAVVRCFQKDSRCLFLDDSEIVHANLNYIFTGKMTNIFTAIPVQTISGLGVCIVLGEEKICVTLRPNTVESD